MKNYAKFLVMLVLGTLLTACNEDWFDDYKYGTDRTLDNITVKGNIAYMALPNGKSEVVYLDSVKSEKAETLLADTINQIWNAIDVSTLNCEKTQVTYWKEKERKGNFRVYDAKLYTVLKFENRSIPLTFTHDLVGVQNALGQDELHSFDYTYVPRLEIVNLSMPIPNNYGLASYRLRIEVFDNNIPIGTIETVLKIYAKSGVVVMI